MSRRLRVAVAGNPNVGKTSLFNALTGSRYKVGNYAGVTVESRKGRLAAKWHENRDAIDLIDLVDLPGIYSLTPMSEDEAVAFEELSSEGLDGILLVLDATNLPRNLYLAAQVRELGVPIVVALNMVDLAREAGLPTDVEAIGEVLGVPVVATIATRHEGLRELCKRLVGGTKDTVGSVWSQPRQSRPPVQGKAFDEVMADLRGVCASEARARFVLCAAAAEHHREPAVGLKSDEARAVRTLAPELIFAAAQELVFSRYAHVDDQLKRIQERCPRDPAETASKSTAATRTERIDAVLTHRVLGPVVFVLVMALVFQSIFTWAEPAMSLIEAGMGGLATGAGAVLGDGPLSGLVTQGIIAGVGNVIVFVPQIALLFLFIGLLEDSGYMARAAFIVDKVMSRVGLSGKSFVPLLSGYACAVPAIMGARTIPRFRDRLVTILMIPFMSCSARLPIYALVIGALFDADRRVFGPFTQGGLILLAMYGLSTISALGIGALYKRTLLRGPTPPLVLELPPYRVPRLWTTLRHVGDRTWDFLRDAGTVILAVTIALWALLSFPSVDPDTLPPGETPIEHSIGGRVGKAMEPALEPIGQDWRMGIGLLGSFAAREVLVSTLGLVYGIENADEDHRPLEEALRTARNEETGEPRHTPLGGVALMVFFVYACQCMSTLAVVRRETRSWKWPAFMLFSMTAIAYLAAIVVYQGGLWLGF